jgi:predicted small lipoprotein YifL
MTFHSILAILILTAAISGCGKVGPLSLPEEKLDKSVITYPCDEVCLEKFEEEKIRQQSVILQTD